MAVWTNTNNQSNDTASFEDVQYRGHFHDIVVDDIIANLFASGGKSIKNIDVFGINGALAIPDGAALAPRMQKPFFIEVKTGFDFELTDNQKIVYPLICIGGHAVSIDPRLRDLGIEPGTPMPPMDIMIAHTFGPGLPYRFESFCKMYGYRKMHHAH